MRMRTPEERIRSRSSLGPEMPGSVRVELADPRQQRLDQQFGTGLRKQQPPLGHLVLLHLFCISMSCTRPSAPAEDNTSRSPTVQSSAADAELALDAARPLALEGALDRNRRRGWRRSRSRAPGGVEPDTLAVVPHPQKRLAPFIAPDDGDVLGARVDRVLDELGDRLQRAVLGKGDDGDGVPLIADAQPAATVLAPPRSLAGGLREVGDAIATTDTTLPAPALATASPGRGRNSAPGSRRHYRRSPIVIPGSSSRHASSEQHALRILNVEGTVTAGGNQNSDAAGKGNTR